MNDILNADSDAEDNDMEWDLEQAKTYEDIIKILDNNDIAWNLIKFENMSVITFMLNNELYVIDDFEYVELKLAREWVDSIQDHNLEKYLPEHEEKFWEHPSILYHATGKEENVNLILKTGLTKQNLTRGISNRSTPSAIFASTEVDDISSYGNYIFEINTKKMKLDGYMPEVSLETPIIESEMRQSIAWKLGLRDYEYSGDSSDGISSSTVIIYGNIPVKYLRLL